MKRFRNFFTPPQFPDDLNKTRVARLMVYSLIILLLIGTIFTPILSFLSGFGFLGDTTNNVVLVINALFCLILIGVIQRGYVRAAGLVVCLFFYALISFLLLPEGAGGRTVSMYALLLAIAGVFVSGRAVVTFWGLIVVTLIAMFYAEITGRLVIVPWTPAGPAILFIQVSVFGLIAILTSIATSTLTRAVNIAQAHERQLLASNRELETLRASLEQRVMDRTKALATSSEVSRRLSTIVDPEQLVKEVVEQVKEAFDYYHAHIYLFDDNRENLLMVGGTGEAGRILLANKHHLPAGRGLVGRAAETNQVVLVPETAADPNWLPNPLLPETKSEAAVPIAVGERVVGVLDVQHNIAGGLKQEDADLLQAIANQVAIALQNARSYETTRRRAEQESIVNRLTREIQLATRVEDVLQIIATGLGQSLDVKRAVVQVQNTTTQPGKN